MEGGSVARIAINEDHPLRDISKVRSVPCNERHFTTVTTGFVKILHHLFPIRSEVQDSVDQPPTRKDFEASSECYRAGYPPDPTPTVPTCAIFCCQNGLSGRPWPRQTRAI